MLLEMAKKEKDFRINTIEFGSKRKPKCGFFILEETETHPTTMWKEQMLYAQAVILDSNPLNFRCIEHVPFAVSHHAIMRFFQRSDLELDNEPDAIAKKVIAEFDFIPNFALIWMFLASKNQADQRRKELMNFREFSIPVPTQTGMFFGHFEKGSLFIRTYLSCEQLNTQQSLLRQTLIDRFSKFQFLDVVYFEPTRSTTLTNLNLRFFWSYYSMNCGQHSETYLNLLIPLAVPAR